MLMYFLLRNNQQTGPFTAEELRAKALKAFDLVWIDGKSAAWRYPGEIEELKKYSPPVEEQPFDRFYRQPSRENQNENSQKKPEILTAYSTTEEQSVILQQNDSLFVTAKAGIKNQYSNEPVKKEELLKKKSFPGEIYNGNMQSKSGGSQQRTGAEPRTSKYENMQENENISPVQKKSSINEPIKVIIADDHAIFRAGVKAALAQKNDVTLIAEADNGRQLLNLLKHTEPDVILLDIQMPLMDGITALPEIRKIYPDVKVVILSMHDDHSMISKMMESGANAYLTKTAGSDAIYQAIKTCYEQEYFFNDTTNKALLMELRTIRSAGNETVAVAKINVAEKPVFIAPEISIQEKPTIKKLRRLHPLWMLTGMIALICVGAITGFYLSRNSDNLTKNTSLLPATLSNNTPEINQQIPAVSNASNTTGVAKSETDISAINPEAKPVLPVEKTVALNTAKQKINKDKNSKPATTGALINTPKEDLTAVGNTKEPSDAETIIQAAKDVNKINIISQVSVLSNKYNKSTFGGVSDIELTVNNSSAYYLDMIVVEVGYLRANDKIIKTEKLYFRNIGPGETRIEPAPNSPRGIKIQYKIISVQSKVPGVSFPGS